ncbi:MAG: TetR family transcriptional regulator [Mycobacterium sp.]
MSTPTSSELPVPTKTMPTRNLSSTRQAATVSSGLALHRRDAILDAVLVLAAEGGYGAVQMRTVSERAGIAVGTLYRYFASKNHLLASALTRQFHRLRGVRDWTTTAGSPQQRLERLTGYLHERWQRDPLLTGVRNTNPSPNGLGRQAPTGKLRDRRQAPVNRALRVHLPRTRPVRPNIGKRADRLTRCPELEPAPVDVV